MSLPIVITLGEGWGKTHLWTSPSLGLPNVGDTVEPLEMSERGHQWHPV